ncbi:MAG: SDR family NAD(P)-dependent oxidoreductase [Pseudarcicella sp.]|nr:SDR family NAD(P)-dependent oxidoreductase [Pseudarcicella sp.]
MTISILACGWLGLPLGEFFVNNNYTVKGSVRQVVSFQKLQELGIKPYQINLCPVMQEEDMEDFIKSDILIINIPPRVSKYGEEYHLLQIQDLIENIKKASSNLKLLFISSTSVYASENKMVDEYATLNQTSVLVKVENMLKSLPNKLTILRCGGLMGYDRFPAKYSSGRIIKNADTPVNYIHRDDVIGIIHTLILQDIWDETFNISSPIHPTRKEVFTKNCQSKGLPLPIFEVDQEEPYKIISPQKIILRTNYNFKYENPLDFNYVV